jgi:alpha-glucosidase
MSYPRLHIKIYDTANQQFTIPESVIERPAVPTTSFTKSSDLVFNYDASPFAFWITRRSDPDTMPIFDTRVSSLPPTPIPPFNSSDPSTAFDAFPLVFEDQYLQVNTLVPMTSCQVDGTAAADRFSPSFRHQYLWLGRGDCQQRL